MEVHIDADEPAASAAARALEERVGAMLFGEMSVRCVRDTDIPVMQSGKTSSW